MSENAMKAVETALNQGVTAAQAVIQPPDTDSTPPIIFVHGNGDSSALWIATIWRFESNGYPKERLFTIDFPYPSARDEDNKDQPGRSSTDDQKQQLAARIDEVLQQTGANKVVLVGNSRGGNSIRNVIKNAGGATKVSKAILCGTPNHGAIDVPLIMAYNEFNGDGPFLKGLNSGSEIFPGVDWLTIRSDHNDKFAQPSTDLLHFYNTGYTSPELNGAKNVILPGVDHRETAYSPQAFAEMYQFITGKAPATLNIVPESAPQISGLVTRFLAEQPTNLGVLGAKVTINAIDQQSGNRIGNPVYYAETDEQGQWGPFTGDPNAYYEFVVESDGQPIRHYFRSPFPRSTHYINLRLDVEPAAAGKGVVIFWRPRGYVATGRDNHSFDGKPVPNVKSGVPVEARFRLEFDGPERAAEAVLNNEHMMVRIIPGEISYAEFTY